MQATINSIAILVVATTLSLHIWFTRPGRHESGMKHGAQMKSGGMSARTDGERPTQPPTKPADYGGNRWSDEDF